jgi:hypothetical protein
VNEDERLNDDDKLILASTLPDLIAETPKTTPQVLFSPRPGHFPANFATIYSYPDCAVREKTAWREEGFPVELLDL